MPCSTVPEQDVLMTSSLTIIEFDCSKDLRKCRSGCRLCCIRLPEGCFHHAG